MDDETTAGELYIDSLCVDNSFRGRGLAKQLLEATIEKGRKMNLPCGLLVAPEIHKQNDYIIE